MDDKFLSIGLDVIETVREPYSWTGS